MQQPREIGMCVLCCACTVPAKESNTRRYCVSQNAKNCVLCVQQIVARLAYIIHATRYIRELVWTTRATFC